MDNPFDLWNADKKLINRLTDSPFYHEREIWWCTIGINIGSEQNGTGQSFSRPVIIIKGFNRNLFLCLALTGKKKYGKYFFYLGMVGERHATAVLSQLRVIDTKRLVKKIAVLNNTTYTDLLETLEKLLFPDK